MTDINDTTPLSDKAKLAFDKRALDFIKEAAREEMVYVLIREGMCIHTDSQEFVKEDDEPMDVIPLWTKSHLDDAKAWAEEYATIEEMPVAYLIEEFLPEIEEKYCAIGLNWDQEGVGRELPPFDLVKLLARQATGEAITAKDLDIEEDDIA